MHLLTLPDELFLAEIFPYLHSADLIRAFATLDNTRLVSLIYAHIRHLDLPDECNYIEALRHYQWTQIRSVRIYEDHLHESICSIFPSLEQLDVRMSSSPTSSCLLSLSTRLTHLRLSYSEAERPSIVNRVARDIWHGDSRISRLSMNNCILMDECYFTEISSSLMLNEYLTHLSIVVADFRSSIPLIALSPVLEHLRICLTKNAPTWSSRTGHFLKRHQWSSRVKSLYFTAHDSYLNTRCFCTYIRLFSASLQRLTFYAQLIQSYPMGNRRSFEECLLNHLPKLNRLDFCVHSGLGSHEYKNRRSFDTWKHHRHVISIFHSWPGSHTRFTLPFVFDRLERVTNDFVDFHSNELRSDFVLTLPSITSISFYAAMPLNVKLMSTIKRACPRLRQVAFGCVLQFHDDLIEDTQLTLPTVKRLCLSRLRTDDHRSVRRLFCLITDIDRLTINAEKLTSVLDVVKHQQRRFDGIRQLIIVENVHRPFSDRAILAQCLPNTNVLYRKRFRTT